MMPSRLQKRLILLLPLALATACTINVPAQRPDPLAEAAANPKLAADIAELRPDPTSFTTQTFEWRDDSRQRPVPARLYLPAQQKEGPLQLIVFSHGLGGSRDGYSYLGRYLASQGFASLHLQHVGSDRHIWQGSTMGLLGRLSDAAKDSEAILRAGDVKFALDQISQSEVGARIDTRHVVMAGHSYGANTAMLVAGAQVPRDGKTISYRDARVSAAILLSAPPFYGEGSPAPILGAIDIPTLHITATDDDIEIPGYRSPYTDRLDIYQAMGTQQGTQKALAVFKDGSHSIFTDRLNTGGTEWNPKVKLATRELVLAFVKKVREGDAGALGRWRDSHAAMLSRFDSAAM